MDKSPVVVVNQMICYKHYWLLTLPDFYSLINNNKSSFYIHEELFG
jgi:hypothetical protein